MHRRAFLALPLGALAVPPRGSHAPAGTKSALVLSGGGCRGYSHIGVLQVLHEAGLKPDLVVGSSSGALVGALYAAGLPVDRMAALGNRLSANLLRDWIFPRLGIFGGGSIAKFVRDEVGKRGIDSLPMGFAAVATDLRNGDMVVFDRGDVGTAVQASGSVPGLLEPVRLGDRLCVDGNLSSPVPVRAARALGAAKVAAVDVTFPPTDADLEDPFDALYQGFSILTRRIALEERAGADAVIEPAIPPYHDMSDQVIREHVEAGRAAAERALPALRKLFTAGSRS
jgi:NTE family protein